MRARRSKQNKSQPTASQAVLRSTRDVHRDRYYFITSRPAPGGDIYHASRVGDVERVTCALLATSHSSEPHMHSINAASRLLHKQAYVYVRHCVEGCHGCNLGPTALRRHGMRPGRIAGRQI